VLCDLGVAVLGGGGAEPAPCTPSFAAPERRAGGPPTPAADVYGLAALAWFAVTAPEPATVLAEVLRLLLALTVPHMAVVWWLDRHAEA
jgi:hypothetical protein